MPLVLLESPTHAKQLAQHVEEVARLDQLDQSGLFKGSAMLRFASRAFNPRLLDGVNIMQATMPISSSPLSEPAIAGSIQNNSEPIVLAAASCEYVANHCIVTISPENNRQAPPKTERFGLRRQRTPQQP